MTSPSHSLPSSGLPAVASVAIIGAGRIGGVLAAALRQAGLTVHGPFGRDETIPTSEVALLCVPDSAIAEASGAVRDRVRFVGHVSGATPLDDVDFSLHPLQTFTGGESADVLDGIGCAIGGRTDAALAIAAGLARALGARPIQVDDAHRAAYHAAASIASNLVLAVLDAAEQTAGIAGIQPSEARALLAPLVQRTVGNWAADGAREALTGPIRRGDELTVKRQRDAVAEGRPELLALFDALCDSTRALAQTEHPLEPAAPALVRTGNSEVAAA